MVVGGVSHREYLLHSSVCSDNSTEVANMRGGGGGGVGGGLEFNLRLGGKAGAKSYRDLNLYAVESCWRV